MILFWFELIALYVKNIYRRAKALKWNLSTSIIFLLFSKEMRLRIHKHRFIELCKQEEKLLYKLKNFEKLFDSFNIPVNDPFRVAVTNTVFFYPTMNQVRLVYRHFNRLDFNFDNIYLKLIEMKGIKNDVQLLKEVGIETYMFLNYVRYL